MRKTIIITDITKVRKGDRAWFKGCDCGFDVIDTGMETTNPLAVINPLSGYKSWGHPSQFEYAVREVEEPEWPDPQDFKLHVYLGADGMRYIYNPCSKQDPQPWAVENSIQFSDRQRMALIFPEALPLTELKLVPVKDDDNE